MLPAKETSADIPSVFYRSKLFAVAAVDAQGRVKAVNEKFAQAFGKPQHRFEHTPFAEAHHPDDAPALKRALERCVENADVTETITLRTLRPTGEFDETEWEFTALPGNADGIRGVLCIGHGVAPSEKQAESRGMNEDTLLQISRGVADIYFTTDLHFNLTFISPSIEKVAGFTVREAMEMPIPDRYPPETLQRMSEVLAEEIALEQDPAADKNRTRTLEGHQYHADGSLIAVNFHVSFIRNEQGVATGLQGITRDVTEARRSAEELRITKERYEQIAVRSRTVVWEVDIDGKYTYMNSAAEALYGYDVSEIVGKLHFYDLSPPDYREEFKEEMLDLIRSGQKMEPQEAVFLSAAGAEIYVLASGEPCFDESGKITGYRGSGTDITERKKAENALMERENTLRELLIDKDRMAKMQSMLFDIALKYINIPLSRVPEAVQQSLRDIGEYTGTHRAVVFSYDFSNNTTRCLYEWTAPGIDSIIVDYQEIPLSYFPNMKEAHKAGRSIYVPNTGNLDEASPERDVLGPRNVRTSLSVPIMREGHCTGFVGIESVGELHDYGDREEILLDVFSGLLNNVQEREKNEKELFRMQVLLEETGQMSGVGGYEMNVKTGLHYWSAVTKQIHEVPMDFEPDIETAIEFYKEGAARDEIKRLVEDSLANGTQYDTVLPIITGKGNERIMKVQGRTEFVDGRAVRLYGTVTDITEMRRKEEREKLLLEISQNQNERLKNFAHIVAHNLRSHSGNIESLLGLIEESREDLKDFDLMRLLRRVSDSLRDTLGHLSEVALLHTAEREPLNDLNLNVHVESAVEVVSGNVKRDDVEIINALNGDETVKALPAYLDSILLNLLTNAIKYRSTERPCTVRITAAEDDRYLRLTVADNGLGIDLERHGGKLFGMFKTFHDHPEARGIGLFITKNQVESMGGRIDVESIEGEGTSFHVRLLRR